MRSWEEKGQMSSSETSGKLELMLSVNCDEFASYPGKVAILLVGSCYKQRDRFWLPVSRVAPAQTKPSLILQFCSLLAKWAMNSRKQHSEPARSRILSILPTIHRVSVNLRNTGLISHKNLAQRRPFRRKKIVFLTIDSLNEFFKRVNLHLYSRLCKCVIIL